MKIETSMNLKELADRMGDATDSEVEAMRDLLVEGPYEDVDDVPEDVWFDLLNQAAE